MHAILVPELFRKLRETPGNNFHLVSSKSESGRPSYDQKTKAKNLEVTYPPQHDLQIFRLDVVIEFSKDPPGSLPPVKNIAKSKGNLRKPRDNIRKYIIYKKTNGKHSLEHIGEPKGKCKKI